jgi:hypothetical protein
MRLARASDWILLLMDLNGEQSVGNPLVGLVFPKFYSTHILDNEDRSKPNDRWKVTGGEKRQGV